MCGAGRPPGAVYYSWEADGRAGGLAFHGLVQVRPRL